MNTVYAIVIGRNESQRLEDCFLSLANQVDKVFYVDSGSTDQSVSIAEKYASKVIELDDSEPFSAARARNIGSLRSDKRYSQS